MKDLNKIMTDWTADLRKAEKIQSLREAVMVTDTFPELARILNANLEFVIGNPDTLTMFELAMKRIRRIRTESAKSWKFELN